MVTSPSGKMPELCDVHRRPAAADPTSTRATPRESRASPRPPCERAVVESLIAHGRLEDSAEQLDPQRASEGYVGPASAAAELPMWADGRDGTRRRRTAPCADVHRLADRARVRPVRVRHDKVGAAARRRLKRREVPRRRGWPNSSRRIAADEPGRHRLATRMTPDDRKACPSTRWSSSRPGLVEWRRNSRGGRRSGVGGRTRSPNGSGGYARARRMAEQVAHRRVEASRPGGTTSATSTGGPARPADRERPVRRDAGERRRRRSSPPTASGPRRRLSSSGTLRERPTRPTPPLARALTAGRGTRRSIGRLAVRTATTGDRQHHEGEGRPPCHGPTLPAMGVAYQEAATRPGTPRSRAAVRR